MSRLVLIVLGIFALPALAMADITQEPILGIFTPTSGDASIYFLGQLFGSVGGVLGSVSGQILGQMFKALNYGMVLLASAMVVYTILMSVVNTAQDGQFMGQQKNTAWTIMRTVGGVSILVPQATGYSFIQVFIMWAVVQGVGLADSTWNKAIDYLQAGGYVYNNDPEGGNQNANANITALIPQASAVLQSATCIIALKNRLENQQSSSATAVGGVVTSTGPSSNYGWGSYVSRSPSAGKELVTLRFGARDPNSSFANVCGAYQAKASTESADYLEGAMIQMASDVTAVAEQYVRYGTNTTPTEQTLLGDQASPAVLRAATNYQNLLGPAVNKVDNSTLQALNKSLDQAKQTGWILAGSYYYKLASIQSSGTKTLAELKPTVVQGYGPPFPVTGNQGATRVQLASLFNQPADNSSDLNFICRMSSASDRQPVTSCTSTTQRTEACGNDPSCDINTKAAALQHKVKDYNLKQGYQMNDMSRYTGAAVGLSVGGLVGGGPIGMIYMGIMTGEIGDLIGKWNSLFKNPSDPLLAVAKLGDDMVSTAISIWVGTAAAVFGTVIVMSIMTSETGVGNALVNAASGFVPIVNAVIITLIVNGVVLAVYIPMIPFLIFFFTSIGWMMSVVEAMVAGPLVALGITHPEGHDLLGKSEQSLMLLLSVFIKPVTMLFGFFTAMIISRVGLLILNYGVSNLGLSTGGLFQSVGMMMVYTLAVISIVNFSFTMVYLLPDKIMRWIGVAPDSFNIESQMGAIKSGLTSSMQTTAKSSVEGAGVGSTKGAQMLSSGGKSGPSGGGGGGGGGGVPGGGEVPPVPP